ncbi:MAG: TolC family outer membrane protein [Parvibaculales bacterium]
MTTNLKTRLFMFLAILALPCLPAGAESFEAALKRTLETNPSLSSERSRYLAIRQNQIVAVSASLPQVSAYARSSTNDMTSINDVTGEEISLIGKHRNDSWGLSAKMDVFTSGKNFSDLMKTRADIRAQRQSLISTEQRVLLGAISAYLGVLRDEAVLSLRQKNVEVLTRQYESVTDQFEVGIVTRTDIAQSESRLELAQARLIRQQASLAASRATYLEVIGVDPENLSAPETLPELPGSLEEALDIAMRQSPAMMLARENSRSADYASFSAVAGSLPKVSLFGTYSITEDPNRMKQGIEEEMTNFGIEVSMPIFTGGKSYAAVRASQHVKNTTRMLVHAARDSVERDVTVSWYNFKAATGEIEASTKQINASEIALDGVKQERELGIRSILDLLNAENELLDARVALIEAERNQIIAAYSLLSSVGRLTGEQLGIKVSDK